MSDPMAPLLKRSARSKQRRTKSSDKDKRATALRMAGVRLLAQSDFENVSIAKIAKTAKCSVGAFYYRYKDKNAYLRQLVAATFRGLENSLQNQLASSGGQISFSEFLSHIIAKLSTKENTGIIRAALKLGATEPDALRPYEDYRGYVAATAESIFKGGSKKKIRAREIREAVQIVFAAINDAALMPKSAAMELGSDEMIKALCEMAASHIGVKPEFVGRITKTTVTAGNESTETSKENAAEKLARKKRPAPGRRRNVKVL